MNLGKWNHPCPLCIWAQAPVSVLQSLCCIKISGWNCNAVVCGYPIFFSTCFKISQCCHQETLICPENSSYLSVTLTELTLLVLCQYQPVLVLVEETWGLRSFSQDLFVLPHDECLLCTPSCFHQNPRTRELWCPSLVSQGPNLVSHLK